MKPRLSQANTVTLRNDKTVSLGERQRRLLDRTKGLNVPLDEIRQRMQKMKKDFLLFKAAVEKYRKMRSSVAAGRALGLSPSTVKDWADGRVEPRSFSARAYDKYDRDRKTVSIPEEKHPEFAYVLGCYFGNTAKVSSDIKGRGQVGIQLTTPDREFAEIFEQKCSGATGLECSSFRQKKYHSRVFRSSNLVQLINQITRDRTTVPTKFLKNREAKRNFLMAIFDSSGSVKRSAEGTPYITYCSRNQMLVETVSNFLKEFGIEHTRPTLYGRPGIRIPKKSFETFARIINFRIGRRREQMGGKK